MLKVQEYLQNNSIESLREAPYFLSVKEYPEDALITLNYSQIDSPKQNDIVKECRGLILNSETFAIVAQSFKRFFNLNECPKTKEWKSHKMVQSTILEKLDGTLITLYRYNSTWHCATRKMAFAEGNTPSGVSYVSLVQKCLDFTDTTHILHTDSTLHDLIFVFELCTPENRVVTRYSDYSVKLLSVRSKTSCVEYDWYTVCAYAEHLGVSTPKVYDFSNMTITDIIASLKDIHPLEEGYVAVHYDKQSSINFDRIKIKNPAYLAISHLRDNGVISPKRIAMVVYMQEQDEYLAYFPEDKVFFDPYIQAYNTLITNITEIWESNRHIEDQKEFALKVKDYSYAGILFSLRKGITLQQSLERLTDDSKLAILQKLM